MAGNEQVSGVRTRDVPVRGANIPAREDDVAARDGDTEHMLPEREVQFPRTIHWAHRRPLGLGPGSLLAALAAITLVFAIVMFAVGSWAAGIVLLAASATEICLFLVAVRREPDSPGARVTRVAASRTDGLARMTGVTVRASTRTGVELARLWHRRAVLRIQLRRRLMPLGEAVYHDDSVRAEQLKAEAHRLDQQLGEAERLAAEARAALQEEIERERVTTQGTHQMPVAGESRSERNGRG